MDKKIKLVVTDLDGTLLDSDKSIPAGFFNAVRTLRSHGVRTVIASGRQYFNVTKLFAPVCDAIDVIAENGGLAFFEGECLFVNGLADEDVIAVLREVAKIPTAYPLLCGARGAYALDGSALFRAGIAPYYERREVSPAAYDHAASDTLCKIAVFDEVDASRICGRFDRFTGRMHLALSGLHWLDFMNQGSDKGVGLQAIQERLGVSPEETMGFGDYDNDVGMLVHCGESYAMANAVDKVKAVCRHRAPSNDEDGVMAVLRATFDFL